MAPSPPSGVQLPPIRDPRKVAKAELDTRTAPLKNPLYVIPLVAGFVAIGVGGVARWLSGNWITALLFVLVVLFAGLLAWLIYLVLSRERAQRLERGIGDDGAVAARRGAEEVQASLEGLEESFARGLADLRASKLSGDPYALPWYLVIGEPGTGKSAALHASGLEMPALYARPQALAPTEHLSWWFTNQAILLDTTGRYLASDDPDDQKEWRRLLRLLRQHRSQLPINGVALALSARSLMLDEPAAFEGFASRLRRRLNEIVDELGVDPPIYLLVTGCDAIAGFTDFAGALPPSSLAEAFGWTNSQRRFPDAGQIVDKGLERVRAQLDLLLPQVLMRESDADRRRRILLLPQEIEAIAQKIAWVARRALNPSVYGDTPFLRGVYFTSALRQGSAISNVMRRLGFATPAAEPPGGASRPLFLRDVFREAMVGDAELAVAAYRVPPRSRRAILWSAASVAALLVFWWCFAGFSVYRAVDELRVAAEPLRGSSTTIAMVNRLREAIEGKTELGFWRRAGLGGSLDTATDRARQSFLATFAHGFESPTKVKLIGEAQQYDEQGFQAVAELGRDVAWLGARAEGPPERRPRLAPYMPAGRSGADASAFADSYDAWIRWSSDADRRARLDREREALASSALQWMDLQRVEAWTQTHQLFTPARYADVGLPAPPAGVRDSVSGAYTKPAWDTLIKVLVGGGLGVEDSASIDEFRRAYVTRFDEQWRRYLLDAPTQAQADDRVRNAPHLAFLQQLEENATLEVPRDGPPPPWIALLKEVRRETAKEGDTQPAPWSQYMVALDQVAGDVAAAQQRSDDAYAFAIKVARGEQTSFRSALDVIRDLVPDRSDPPAAAKLREILAMPVLNGLSAVLERAVVEVDRSWQTRIVTPYGGNLEQAQLKALYAPRDGDLAKFDAEVLAPFVADGRPKNLLADRALPLGAGFLAWNRDADALQRTLFPVSGGAPKITVRLEGVPSRVVSGSALFVSRQDLNLTCPDGIDSFVYRQGTGAHAFQWTPECNEVSLRVWMRQPDGQERELLPAQAWTGPLALPEFLRAGSPAAGAGVTQWTLTYPDDGIELAVSYRLRSGREAMELAHRTPPQSVRE